MTPPRKPHPFGNEYHTIADGDDGKPIMWRMKIVEGKDHPKKADGTWAFPSKFKRMGYSKTIDLLLERLSPFILRVRLSRATAAFALQWE
jgi:hypothetical protein